MGINFQEILLMLPAILFGLSFHEFCHAYVAVKLGDETPRRQKRLTLNPLAHFDPIGFLMLLIVRFGWAKPVEINPQAFKHPRRDEVLVSLAGPLANLITAVVFVVLIRLFIGPLGRMETYGRYIFDMMQYFVVINLGLMIFNLLPIPPLDGSHLVFVVLPDRWVRFKIGLYRYGSIALLGVIVLERVTNLDLLPIGKAVFAIYSGLFRMVGLG